MTLLTRIAKGSKLTIAEMDGNLEYLESLGLVGTSYVFVSANGTDIENAAELQAAYNLAKTKSPTSTNRVTVICGNGNYSFTSSFLIDTEFIDLVSLDGNKSIVFNGVGTISITANDVFVKGVNVLDKIFTIDNTLNLLKLENCQGGDYSFEYIYGIATNCIGGEYSFSMIYGTVTNCQGGGNSFEYIYGIATNCIGGEYSFGTIDGTINNCQGGDYSFGALGTIYGTVINCQGGYSSFGTIYNDSIVTNCQGGDNSFGSINGTVINCIGKDSSFGTIYYNGVITNCQGGDYSFGNVDGTITNCQGGDYSFGNSGTINGIITNCIGGESSFGTTLDAKLYYCVLTIGTFITGDGFGKAVYCIDGNGDTFNY